MCCSCGRPCGPTQKDGSTNLQTQGADLEPAHSAAIHGYEVSDDTLCKDGTFYVTGDPGTLIEKLHYR